VAKTVKLGHIDIEYVCEKCGRPDSYSQVLQGEYTDQRSNYKGPLIEAENRASLIERLTKKRDWILASYREVQIRACPGCHHQQSWMADSDRRETLQLAIGGGVVVLGLVLAVVELILGNCLDTVAGFSVMYLIAASVIGMIVYRFLADRGPAIDLTQLKNRPVMAWKA